MMAVEMPSCMAMATTYRPVGFLVLPVMVVGGGVQVFSRREAMQVWWKTDIVPDCTVPAWADRISCLSNIPRPALTVKCSREDFASIKTSCGQYKRYHNTDGLKNENEIRDQLFSCLSKAVQKHVYQYLGLKIVTIIEEDMIAVIKFFVVKEVEQAVCDAHGNEVPAIQALEIKNVMGVNMNMEQAVCNLLGNTVSSLKDTELGQQPDFVEDDRSMEQAEGKTTSTEKFAIKGTELEEQPHMVDIEGVMDQLTELEKQFIVVNIDSHNLLVCGGVDPA